MKTHTYQYTPPNGISQPPIEIPQDPVAGPYNSNAAIDTEMKQRRHVGCCGKKLEEQTELSD